MTGDQPSHGTSWLSANVIGLAINRFLSDFGHEAGTAILPLFLNAIGAPPLALGLIEGAADGLSSFAKLFGGWLGDKVERRTPWAAAGYFLTGLSTGLYGLFSFWPWVLLMRTIGWAGRGLRSPLHDAILTDSVPAEARGRAFGFDEAADTAGAIGGPLAALAIVGPLTAMVGAIASYKIGFWLACIPGILAALSILVLVKETPHALLGATTWFDSLRSFTPAFKRYVLTVLVFGCGDFSHTLLILYAVEVLGKAHFQSAGTLAILLYTAHNVLYAAGAYPAGILADRIGKARLLVFAYALAVAMNIFLLATGASVIFLVLAFLFAGAGYALQQSLERAIVADLVPASSRSTGFGILASINGVGDLISSLVVGGLWTAFSPNVAFAYSLALSLLGTVLLLRVVSNPAIR